MEMSLAFLFDRSAELHVRYPRNDPWSELWHGDSTLAAVFQVEQEIVLRDVVPG